MKKKNKKKERENKKKKQFKMSLSDTSVVLIIVFSVVSFLLIVGGVYKAYKNANTYPMWFGRDLNRPVDTDFTGVVQNPPRSDAYGQN